MTGKRYNQAKECIIYYANELADPVGIREVERGTFKQ